MCILVNLWLLVSHDVGIKKLRFKPAYNPYTEPSMEIFSYHEGLAAVLVLIAIEAFSGRTRYVPF